MTITETHGQPIRKILVANRGEIAVRVIRSAREMDIKTVAVYAEQDIHTLAVDLADEAYALEGTNPAATYMNVDKLLEVAQRSGADAVHPGYGFLAENQAFARAVTEAGLTWIGPSHRSIGMLGDKIQARQLAEKVGVQTIPGVSAMLNADEAGERTALDFAKQAGFPILIKRADAGGGRGITRLDDEQAIRQFIRDHQEIVGSAGDGSTGTTGDGSTATNATATTNVDSEATASSTNAANTVSNQNTSTNALGPAFLEKLMLHCRHVETQCARDAWGTFAVISTRDCSVQRRHQKVIEEAPAPDLSPETVQTLVEYSRLLFEAAGYVGLGTTEFLVDPSGKPYFLEVNPRLQVEHTVSEQITGLDLVKWQIRIASGAKLNLVVDKNGLAPARGHAFEVRLTSEDPANQLMPATGSVTALTWPGGPGVRIDAYVRAGDQIGGAFDSLIGKITVWDLSREEALARVRRALDETHIGGLPTSLPLIKEILEDQAFSGAPLGVFTTWLEDTGLLERLSQQLKDSQTATVPTAKKTAQGGAAKTTPPIMEEATIEWNGQRVKLRFPRGLFAGPAVAARTSQPLRSHGNHATSATECGSGTLTSPMQATVVRILTQPGQHVKQGDTVLVIEAMKMEKNVSADVTGTVQAIPVAVGDAVTAGQLLATIEEDQ